jgi:hypothetical protein
MMLDRSQLIAGWRVPMGQRPASRKFSRSVDGRHLLNSLFVFFAAISSCDVFVLIFSSANITGQRDTIMVALLQVPQQSDLFTGPQLQPLSGCCASRPWQRDATLNRKAESPGCQELLHGSPAQKALETSQLRICLSSTPQRQRNESQE